MRVYTAIFQLHLPSRSLKGKRSIVKSILARSRSRFNVAAAEVDRQDEHGTAIIAFVTVAENGLQARRLLEELEAWLVDERPDVDVAVVEIEER